MFVWEDCFVVGLGLDIAGAYLLSRGLLAPAPQMVQRATAFYGDNPYPAVSLVDDRIAGWFGLVSLVSGFVVQAIAYAFVLAGRGTHEYEATQGVVAVVLALFVVLIVVGAERVSRTRLRARELVEMARYSVNEQRLADHPSGKRLQAYGRVLGGDYLRREHEPLDGYGSRAWRVTAISDHD